MLSACVDWISFSISTDPPGEGEQDWHLSAVKERLGLGEVEWSEAHGHDGYRKCHQHLGIGINFDSTFVSSAAFLLLTLSGEGCRTWEAVSGMPVAYLIKANSDWVVTRLDLAIDDISQDDDYYLDLPLMMQSMNPQDSMFVSRLSRYSYTCGNMDQEARFGSRSSRVYIRIYDKKLERMVRVGECDAYHWVRCEVEFKAEKASAAACLVAQHPDEIGSILSGILLEYLMFTVEPRSSFSDRNMRRDAVPSKWWMDFLKDTEPLKLQPGPGPERNFDTVKKWITEQCPRNLAIVALVEGRGVFNDLEEYGRAKFTAADRIIIDQARREKHEKDNQAS